MPLFDEIQTLADVQRLLIDEEVREGESIDYKRADVWIKDHTPADIAKHFSAFANGAGGLLVFGVATRKDDPTLPERIVPIDPANVQRIKRAPTNHLSHSVTGVRFREIGEDGRTHVLLAEVPSSPLAPHQSKFDLRYYRRQGDESLPMSHELVELYFGRRLGPALEVTLAPGESQPLPARVDDRARFAVEILVRNVGRSAARDSMLVLQGRTDLDALAISATGASWEALAPQVRGVKGERRFHSGPVLLHPTDELHAATLHVVCPLALMGMGLPVGGLWLYTDGMRPLFREIALAGHYGSRCGLKLTAAPAAAPAEAYHALD